MTFGEALSRIKLQHLPDESTERLGDDRMVGALNMASSEIASAFSIGRYPYGATLDDPSGGELLLTPEQVLAAYDLEEVAVGSLIVRRTNLDQARLYRHVSGPPRYYTWERMTPRHLRVFPAPKGPVSVVFTLLKEMPTVIITGTTVGDLTTRIWFGAYAPWHDLVVLKAVEKLLTAQSLFEEAGQYQGRYAAREQEFSAHMQGLSKDVAMAMAARA